MKILRKIAVFSSLIYFSSCHHKTEIIHNKTNIIKLNDRFYVRLPENHNDIKDGFWQMDAENSSKKGFNYLGSFYRGNDKGVEFHFTAAIKGNYILNIIKTAHKDTIDTKTFNIIVE
jgi:truncated hemoglobin YjbI